MAQPDAPERKPVAALLADLLAAYRDFGVETLRLTGGKKAVALINSQNARQPREREVFEAPPRASAEKPEKPLPPKPPPWQPNGPAAAPSVSTGRPAPDSGEPEGEAPWPLEAPWPVEADLPQARPTPPLPPPAHDRPAAAVHQPVAASPAREPETPTATPKLSLEEKRSLMSALRAEIGDCTRCRLHAGRTTIVFGEGNLEAELMFIGEGPGANEDRTGRPFVGRAGQLLDRMITAMKTTRENVYIANIVKCRPPDNRAPEPDESAICGPFVLRQAEIVQPRVIVCLGGTAAKFLLSTQASVASLRGRVLRWRFAEVVCTYHPSYLLQNPASKKAAWEDLQKAMALLGTIR